MKRAEAEDTIRNQKRVICSLPVTGTYTGKLVEIVEGERKGQWKGRMLVDGVLESADPGDPHGGYHRSMASGYRMGYEVGEEILVGASCLVPMKREVDGTSYFQAMENQARAFVYRVKLIPGLAALPTVRDHAMKLLLSLKAYAAESNSAMNSMLEVDLFTISSYQH